MHRFMLAALFALLGVTASVAAQEPAGDWRPRSGDAWIDARLADINQYGARWPQTFTDEVVRYHHAPRSLVDALLQRRWAPGDIYFACVIADAAGRPCRAVIAAWEQHHAEGWGELARRFGVPPGSPAFHRIKGDVVASYERWGRPLPPDDALRADVPGRGALPPGLPAPPPEPEDARREHATPPQHGPGHATSARSGAPRPAMPAR